MANEIEVKVLNIDKELLENKLINMGASLIKKEMQVNTIFMDIDGDIEDVGRGYLRLRESENLTNGKKTSMITFKRNLSQDGFRENEEIETLIEDKDSMVRILSCLNIDVKNVGRKERLRYNYEGIQFDIDTWDEETYPHPYLEIEVKDSNDIQRAIEILDIDKKDVTTKSLKELREDLKNRGVILC